MQYKHLLSKTYWWKECLLCYKNQCNLQGLNQIAVHSTLWYIQLSWVRDARMKWNIHVAGMVGTYMARKYNLFFFDLGIWQQHMFFIAFINISKCFCHVVKTTNSWKCRLDATTPKLTENLSFQYNSEILPSASLLLACRFAIIIHTYIFVWVRLTAHIFKVFLSVFGLLCFNWDIELREKDWHCHQQHLFTPKWRWVKQKLNYNQYLSYMQPLALYLPGLRWMTSFFSVLKINCLSS